MKRILLWLSVICWSVSGYSQITFNNRYHLNLPAVFLSGVVATDSAYYAIGLALDSVPPYRQSSLFVKFNLDGNLVYSKKLTDPGRIIYTAVPSLIQTNDGLFAAAGITLDSIRRVFFVKYDEQGDTIFTRNYLHPLYPEESFVYIHDLIQTENDEFLLVGNMENPQGIYNTDKLIIKLDANGNEIWKTSFGDLFNDELAKCILVDVQNGGYIVGGVKNNMNVAVQNYTSQCQVLRIDENGVVQSNQLTDLSTGLWRYAEDMVQLEDGSLVIATGEGTEVDWPSVNQIWFDKCVFKLPPDGEIVWKKVFKADYLSGSNFLPNIERISDGSGFIIAGTEHEPLWDQNNFTIWGWVSKVSNEGDSLWTRKYAYQEVGWEHKILDLKESSDGGFILCGESRDYEADSIAQQAWLLKLDQHGCLLPGCHLPNPTQEPGKPEISLAIYPNPTTDYLNFQLRSLQPVKNATFRIVNAVGQVIKSFAAREAGVTFILPVWDWASGAYYLQYLENEQVLQTQQFIKQ